MEEIAVLKTILQQSDLVITPPLTALLVFIRGIHLQHHAWEDPAATSTSTATAVSATLAA